MFHLQKKLMDEMRRENIMAALFEALGLTSSSSHY